MLNRLGLFHCSCSAQPLCPPSVSSRLHCMGCIIFVVCFRGERLDRIELCEAWFPRCRCRIDPKFTRKVASNDSDDPKTVKLKTMQWRLNITQFLIITLFFCLNLARFEDCRATSPKLYADALYANLGTNHDILFDARTSASTCHGFSQPRPW